MFLKMNVVDNFVRSNSKALYDFILMNRPVLNLDSIRNFITHFMT